MRDEYCRELVWGGGTFRGIQCKNKVKLDGYCGIHHPKAKEKRRIKSQDAYEEGFKARKLAHINMIKTSSEYIKLQTEIAELKKKQDIYTELLYNYATGKELASENIIKHVRTKLDEI